MGRFRKIVMWLSLAAGILMASVWIGARFYFFSYASTASVFDVCPQGVIWSERQIPAGTIRPNGWRFTKIRSNMSIHGGDTLQFRYTNPQFFACPFWLLLLLALAPGALLWRRSPPQLQTGCPHCRYDLTGNITGVCPECGKVIENK